MKESVEVRDFYSKKYDEKVVLHRWCMSINSKEFTLMEDYYLIRDKKVYIIQEYGTDSELYATGDNVSEAEQCVEIGDYSEEKHKNGDYSKRVRNFDVKDLEPILK